MITQYGVLAYRHTAGGEPEVLLITSRRTGRWVIPRGNPIAGLEPPQSAAQEAFEEGGLTGVVSAQPIGSYEYEKIKRGGESVPAEVLVFPLLVTRQSEHWPERHERDTRWFVLDEAAAAVEEPGLKEIILRFTPAHGCG